MAWVETQTAYLATALTAVVASVATSSNPVVLSLRGIEVPVTSTNMSSWVFGSWGTTFVSRLPTLVYWTEGDWNVDTIDNLNIVEIFALLDEGEFSLSGWLGKTLTGFATTLTATAVSSLATTTIAVSSSSDSTTPNDFITIIVYGNADLLGAIRVYSVVTIVGSWVLPETLSDISSLDTTSS